MHKVMAAVLLLSSVLVLPTGGAVVRGCALLSSYSMASPFFKTALGSVVEVFYLPDNPKCNGLRLALLWEL
jgi:hypothetical protein